MIIILNVIDLEDIMDIQMLKDLANGKEIEVDMVFKRWDNDYKIVSCKLDKHEMDEYLLEGVMFKYIDNDGNIKQFEDDEFFLGNNGFQYLLKYVLEGVKEFKI